ncbi:protein bride of sevenless [Wyeomyia smithii]|uniref:protein bride of sevenless n=1 Tax=Wyeomyia smithii TaxID=174621 RepID=UPI0024681FF0|nr:protein bride of sevenless [Wyeomyia smithii]XP_055546101.1 protein bride of sevenless [Wyeomyia smithii]XP_055546102.1 protein bride of sevenless [Wyeomyia smithii]XP_055546104.1 protein bride of sevenless [Wyeomyia smithii]XP_055546105.1 protein bride of sevenless [Wyeomyia smithii]XP_055546106.1 protein bride of sevenless [Wyeomyia smithii]XP_055546107.1 protein bride of sevenless [Wyeomyia smithii]XP_055546108.1 protein bride of sevenless [Wyeomyia smithii]XP_055546109.1 protein brid
MSMIMRSENKCCVPFYAVGLLVLPCLSAWVRSDEAVSAIGSTPAAAEADTTQFVSTLESIHTTKVIEEISDNSITISPTASPYWREFAPFDNGTDTNHLEENETLHKNFLDFSSISSEASDANDTSLIKDDTGARVESTTVTGLANNELSLQNCSLYFQNRTVVDMSFDGGFRNMKLEAHSHPPFEAPIAFKDRTAEVRMPDLSSLFYSLEGDYMVSLITNNDDFGAILFIVDRINDLQLIKENGTLGLRIMFVRNTSDARQRLQDEVEYCKKCSRQSIGIFIVPSLWPFLQPFVGSMDFNIFLFPASDDLLYAMAAHLLYELPWSNPNSSVAVRSESTDHSNKFVAMCRLQQLCFENFPSDHTIFIVLGLTPSISFATNGTLIVILSGQDRLFVSDLPDGSYMIAENDINLSAFENQLELVTNHRYGTKLLASELFSSASVFLKIVDLLNSFNPTNENDSLVAGVNFGAILRNWQYYDKIPMQSIVTALKLDNITHLMTFEMRQKFNPGGILNLKSIASSNLITNVTTVHKSNDIDYHPSKTKKLGTIFYCTKEFESRHPEFANPQKPIYYGKEYAEMYWQIKQEPWVAAGLTVSSLGILFCLAILIFIIVRICLDDVMEGNPLSSMLLLVSLIFQFASFLPFCLEYTGYIPEFLHRADNFNTWNTLCVVKLFLVSVCYCFTFSILLCRSIMLASIGSEGGFLSHVNGYLQSVICVFSALVQLGLSSQLAIVFHANTRNISCNDIYFGNWFWGIIAYDGVLLAALVILSPYVFKSQRNYREGLLLVTGSILCLIIWSTWIPLSMFGYEWREAAVSLGLVATATAILVGVMVPRCFLMVRSISRADLVQALPSLTSLAFNHANQCMSDQSVYECVNPAMRQQRSVTAETFLEHDMEDPYMATREIPTLPLRGNRRSQGPNGEIIGAPFFYGINNSYNCSDSIRSDISPSKITRF